LWTLKSIGVLTGLRIGTVEKGMGHLKRILLLYLGWYIIVIDGLSYLKISDEEMAMYVRLVSMG
jgi:hypothetical protein